MFVSFFVCLEGGSDETVADFRFFGVVAFCVLEQIGLCWPIAFVLVVERRFSLLGLSCFFSVDLKQYSMRLEAVTGK